jgi:tRNA(Ile)-lysidine synthase
MSDLNLITASLERHALLPPHGTVIVAVSGGADSLCLLHMLHRLCGPGKLYPPVRLHAAHLDHQLRSPASAEDARVVEQLVRSWGLPITVGRSDVPALARREQRSLEEAARIARYRFLRELAQGQPIAVAHHRDDQVETLLLHWLRGGGLASVVGLQPRQQDIIRPLLDLTHADTLAYCARHQITPLEDASNTDPRFLRNRVRHELLPLLSQLNPGFSEVLLRTSEVMQTDLAWIEQQVTIHWPLVVTCETPSSIQFAVEPLRALPLSLQRHLLRHATARLNLGQSPLELRHYRLLADLLTRETGETLRLHLPQQVHAIRRGPLLEFCSQQPNAIGMVETSPSQLSQSPRSRPLGQPGEPQDEEAVHPGPPPTRSFLEPTHPEESLLPVPGTVVVPGTPWIASAAFIPDDLLRAVQPALQREDWEMVWHLLPSTPYTVYIDTASLVDTANQLESPSVRVRTRRPGDRIRPLGMRHEKKVQDVLVNRHIPSEEREQIPLFFGPTHCLWLAGVQIDDRARLNNETRRVVRLTIEPHDQAVKQTLSNN